MTLEKMEQIVEEVTLNFYKELEKENGIEFTTEEVRKAIRIHQDTIDFEEKDLDEEEFEETYREWMEDAKDEVVSMKLEKLIEEAIARMKEYQRKVGAGRIAYMVEQDTGMDIFLNEFKCAEEAFQEAKTLHERLGNKKQTVKALVVLAGNETGFYEDEDGEIFSDREEICRF